jgi:cytoplasmic iron level regulating protein YaaA (DUF328/UPF0246 family)
LWCETRNSSANANSIDKLAIIWAALDPARDQLIAALGKLCQDSEKATKALKLGKESRAEVAKNLSLMSSPTMPALHRYAGVLYQALDANSLSPKALKLAGERLFIQSALFGLLPALEQIPDYRFSASSKLPGVNLIQVWTRAHEAVWPRMVGPILDMRSSEYQELNPIPKEREQYQVEVFSEDGKLLNHFNKRSKGLFVRAALENNLTDISQVAQVGAQAGLRTEVEGRTLKLFAP